jgi:hypothetical protein
MNATTPPASSENDGKLEGVAQESAKLESAGKRRRPKVDI